MSSQIRSLLRVTNSLRRAVNPVRYSSDADPSAQSFFKEQGNLHFTARSKLVPTLQSTRLSCDKDVILENGDCRKCQTNFYSNGCLNKSNFRQFVSFLFKGKQNSVTSFKQIIKTLDANLAEKIMNKELDAIEKLVRMLPQPNDILFIVDGSSIYYDRSIDNPKHRHTERPRAPLPLNTIEVTEYLAPFKFQVRAKLNAKRTMVLSCGEHFPGYDDIVCLFISVLLPQMPLVHSRDGFEDHMGAAVEFSKVSEHKDFGAAFKIFISNSTCRTIYKSRDGFYCSSLDSTRYHVIEGGESYCFRDNK